ncbi:MAG: hypothetical protein K2J12_09600 [Muribaculaceae bacterium]|nr:hypothetical protein [Muribaculaceae bacterium]
MKKFLLLLAGVSAYLSADAIQLTFYIGDQKVTPGQTVIFNNIEVTEYPEDEYKEVMMDPKLSIMSDFYSSDIKITADCTSGQIIQVCANGVCRSNQKVVLDKVKLQNGKKVDLGFEYRADLDLDEAIPTVVTAIEAEDVTESGSKVQFIIEMSEKSASVTAVEISDELQPVEGGIAYKVSGEVAPLRITSIVGINVFSANVNGEGIIALPKGLYVYTFGNRSGKIYIR